jgi:hypothetical protein
MVGRLHLGRHARPAHRAETWVVDGDPWTDRGPLALVPGAGGGNSGAELEVESDDVGHEVAPDEVDGGLEALVDPKELLWPLLEVCE